MTGFAALSREVAGETVHVTAKSVNHRFLDIAVKMPQALAPLDSRVRVLAQERLTRGRLDLSISAEVTSPPVREVVLDELLLEQVADALGALRARGVVSGPLTPSDLLRLPQVLEIRTRPADPAAPVPASLTALVEAVVADTLDALVGMRATEGRYLSTDLEARLTTLGGFVAALEQEAAAGQRQLDTRLRERLAALPADLQGDPAAVAQEVVRVVSRSDVDEEIVRLRGHLEHWRGLAAGADACGRKLDFLVQEMNREVNTIGSKVEGLRATEVVIAAKAELERVKEQVQNVE